MSDRPFTAVPRDAGVLETLLGDGRLLIFILAVGLTASGAFAILQSVSGHFLPHDVRALGVDAEQLAQTAGPRLVLFMFHDRVAFGGVLLALGAMYAWLAGFPLRDGERWAWWAVVISCLTGFLSFLAYLGYGYLDTWHAVATVVLLPVSVAGIWRVGQSLGARPTWRDLRQWDWPQNRAERLGRVVLAGAGVGIMGAGLTILGVGMTRVFVPEDLAFIGLGRDAICGFNPRLVPVIAHDRAGFGGGLFSVGVLVTMIAIYARISRSLLETLAVVGFCGFGAAVGVHYVIGYTNWFHVAPAWLGAFVFFAGVGWLTASRRPENLANSSRKTRSDSDDEVT